MALEHEIGTMATTTDDHMRRSMMNSTNKQTKRDTVRANRRVANISRRDTLRLLSGLGLAAAGVGTIGLGARTTGAASSGTLVGSGAPHRHTGMLASPLTQDEGTPVAPQLGEQPDGSRLWRVRVAGMDMEAMIETQAIFPKELTINAGDAVLFEFPDPPGFHTMTFLSGEEAPPIIIPDEAAAAAASPPPGPPPLVVNPLAAFPSERTSYDGAGFVNSGLDVLREPGDQYILTFTKPGTYPYQCIPHGVVMKATLVVQEAGAALPEDQAAADARGDQERAALIAEGKAEIAKYRQATSTARDDGTTLWEIAAGVGEGQARVPQFLPNALQITAGDTVRWVNRSRTEPHTVTFLGADGEQPEDVLVEPQASGQPKLVQNPLTFFRQGGDRYDGQEYCSSGFLGDPPFPGGLEYELTFDEAGAYPYYCILHGSGPEGPGMTGTIIVSLRVPLSPSGEWGTLPS